MQYWEKVNGISVFRTARQQGKRERKMGEIHEQVCVCVCEYEWEA